MEYPHPENLLSFRELDMQTIIKHLSIVRCVYLPFLLSYDRETASLTHLRISNSIFQATQFFKVFSLLLLFLTIQSHLIKLVSAALFPFSFSLDEFQLSSIPFVLSFARFLLH